MTDPTVNRLGGDTVTVDFHAEMVHATSTDSVSPAVTFRLS